ncbi:MAG: hypothetical protein MRERV_13c026 [Mycoplasmataceae bacterium RV_VA103A]|nr:MAG: hypothetical protein MRERV_13c026 [Mycoplasmataceae bacterium RV_VA103A]
MSIFPQQISNYPESTEHTKAKTFSSPKHLLKIR